METDIPLDLINQVLQQTFGTQVEIAQYQISKKLHDYLVLLVQLRHPAIDIVIKLAGPAAPLASFFDRTALLHQLVAQQTSIPVCEILAVNMSYQTWPWRYLIKRFIAGQEWAAVRPLLNRVELSGAYQQLGAAVAQLHTIRFPVFGEIDLNGDREAQPYAAALAEHARGIIQSDHLRDLFSMALEKNRALFTDVDQPRLCHEDLHKYNILFQYDQGQWRLATILDFDKAWAGHPESDLARLELWKGMTTKDFWEAYHAICAVDALYEQRRPIYQLLWCFEYADPSEAHLADTRRLCAQLGLPRFSRFD
ncbi:MAG: hypothetical protein CVU39_11850 [Chloroflexi bacterium HGW-Chloroflexi-10]|nr:MAG: hypothetical protein CVU39_11850 [Chloroflexi bacterium HGW-Chloroflexi-10]